MIRITNIEKLEPGKYYKAKHKPNSKEYSCICQVIKKHPPTYSMNILEGDSNWKKGLMTISFYEFKNYVWFELTEDEAMVELL
jgi:hypothetical protein